MEDKNIWRLVLILGVIAIVGIGYMINDLYIKSYWDDRCREEALSVAQNASSMATQWIIQDICDDGRIDVNENGTIRKVSLNEICSR